MSAESEPEVADLLHNVVHEALADGATPDDLTAAFNGALEDAPVAAARRADAVIDELEAWSGVDIDDERRLITDSGVSLTLELSVTEPSTDPDTPTGRPPAALESVAAESGEDEPDQDEGDEPAADDEDDPIYCGICGAGPFDSVGDLGSHHGGKSHDGEIDPVAEPPADDKPDESADTGEETHETTVGMQTVRAIETGGVETLTELADELDVTTGQARKHAMDQNVYGEIRDDDIDRPGVER